MVTITADRLRELVDYDPASGVFTWRTTRCGRALAGSKAGTVYSNGYRYLWIDGGRYLAHRLAWLHSYGQWPSADVDHIDCNKSNNAISNLREASSSQNHFRVKSKRRSRGVYNISPGRWRAKIGVRRQAIHLGYFASEDDARMAYRAAAILHFGEFSEGAL